MKPSYAVLPQILLKLFEPTSFRLQLSLTHEKRQDSAILNTKRSPSYFLYLTRFKIEDL